jgi:branched-chain amino acid transport system ATP-binding protein
MTASTAIRFKDVHAWYGESHILHGVNFEVKSGEVVSLLGRNGAGRTTSLRALMGLVGKRTGPSRSTARTRCAWRRTTSPSWAWATAPRSAAS